MQKKSVQEEIALFKKKMFSVAPKAISNLFASLQGEAALETAHRDAI